MKKTQNTNQKSRLLILLGTILLAATSCTKELPYETVVSDKKDQVYDKSLIDTKAEYLYASAQQSSSMSSPDAFPFYTGDNKRVRLQITEKSIRVLETERDERYQDNDNNDKLVIEIPIEHVQFQCAKDAFGECTNKEEDAASIPWNQKNSMRVKFETAKAGQVEVLPILDSATFGDNCFADVAEPEIIFSKVEASAINFQMRRTFKVASLAGSCGNGLSSLKDTTFSAVFHYSMVKVDSVISKDYKTISYPEGSKDENTFGFFSTARTALDVDHTNTEKSKVQIMNRWNPNRKEITYYLSDEFAKPKNKKINDLTVQTVNNLNEGLQEAGVNFRINLKQPEGKLPGDIRNSMIVLVEDPTAASVIGYGPQTEDPVTGEIISARTIMYLGTIQNGVKHTYNDIIRIKREAKALKAAPAVAGEKAIAKLALAPELQSKINGKIQTGRTFGINSAIQKSANDKTISDAKKAKELLAQKQSETIQPSKIVNAAKIKSEVKNYTKRKNDLYTPKDPKEKLAASVRYMNEVKNCAFQAGSEGVSGEISEKLMNAFDDNAKPWDQLSDSEKEYAMDVILPATWIPTLIHELGHNLGLRHNFQGSEDKANFFNSDELTARHIDHTIPFSSVMEYGDDLKALPVLGKYDIAALRFGYKREVDVVGADGSISTVAIPEKPRDKKSKLESGTLENDLQLANDQVLRDFGYCTDEHTGINAGCKRFDLGTSYTEITQNMIRDYENWYYIRNFRNGRFDMSVTDDFTYARRIGMIFEDLRIMFEVRERIKYMFNLPEGHPIWQTNEFLKDIDQAALLAGQQLAKVIAVPDLTCAIAEKADPMTITELANIKDVDRDAMDCFKADINAGKFAADKEGEESEFMVVAQTGKRFNPFKDPANRNSYADQIDVRGYWIDKVLATNALFSRTTALYTFDRVYADGSRRMYPNSISTFEQNQDSFLDLPTLTGPLMESIKALMNDNVVDTLDFTLADGSVLPLEVSYELSKTQVIEKHMIKPIATLLGVNEYGPTKLQQILAENVVYEARDVTGQNKQDLSLEKGYSVYKLAQSNNVPNSPDNKVINVIFDTFVAAPDNTLAHDMISSHDAALPIETNTLAAGNAKTDDIIARKEKGEVAPTTGISPLEKQVWGFTVAQIKTPSLRSQIVDLLGQEIVRGIMIRKSKGETKPAVTTPIEDAIWAIDLNNYVAFINGVIKPSAFYVDMIQALPAAR